MALMQDTQSNTQPEKQPPTLPPKDSVDTAQVLKVIACLPEVDDNQPHTTQPAYMQGSAITFRYLCDLLEVDHSHIPHTNAAKRAIFPLIMQAVCFIFTSVLLQYVTKIKGPER